MTWTYHTLKFMDEVAAKSVLGDRELTAIISNIDVVGTILHEDESPVEGWHVNIALKGEIPEVLAAFEIPQPQHQKREWLRVMPLDNQPIDENPSS